MPRDGGHGAKDAVHRRYKTGKDKQEETQEEVTVPELRNKTVEEAKKELKEIGLELEIKQEVENELENEINTKEKVIIEQVPKPEVKIRSGNKVTVEIE